MNAAARTYEPAGNTFSTAGDVHRDQEVLVEKVFVVDDDPAVRVALETLLEKEGYSVTTHSSAESLLDSINDASPATLVVDQHLDAMSGLDLQSQLAKRGIDWPIVFLSGHGNVDISVRAMKAGAVDFLEKPCSNTVLLKSIRTAFSRIAAAHEDNTHRNKIEKKCLTLTPREREVMRLVTQGFQNKEIAQQLGNGRRTVEVHRSRVMSKMGASSLAELVRMVDVCRVCSGGIAGG